MSFYDTIAAFINNLLLALKGLASIGNFASNPLGAFTQNENKTNQSTQGSVPLQNETKETQAPAISTNTSKRKAITIPEHINARFNDTGSSAWANQPGGRHLGTDFGAPNGSPVYAPYTMRIVKIGHYDDEGRRGDYVIGTLNDGTEYYSGHLGNVRVNVGDTVAAGNQIASIGMYNHTHIQLRVNGILSDFEVYEKSH